MRRHTGACSLAPRTKLHPTDNGHVNGSPENPEPARMQPLQDTSKPLPVCLVFPGLISSGQDSEPHVQESKPVLAGQGAQYVGMLQKQKDIPALLRKLPMVPLSTADKLTLVSFSEPPARKAF